MELTAAHEPRIYRGGIAPQMPVGYLAQQPLQVAGKEEA